MRIGIRPGADWSFDDTVLVLNTEPPRSFSDDFADGDYTWSPAWPVSGTWSIDDDSGAEDNYFVNTADTVNRGFDTPVNMGGPDDFTVTWAFYAEDVPDDDWMLRHWARFNNSNGARVELRAEEVKRELLNGDSHPLFKKYASNTRTTA
jgi:hypothetical protein